MIKSTELRIGNILKFDGVLSLVTAIDFNLAGVCKEAVAHGDHQYIELASGRVQGWSIDEDALLIANFKKVGKISDSIGKWSDEAYKFIIFFNGSYAGLITSLPKSVPVYYVHQLQNLYFSLIGEELTILR